MMRAGQGKERAEGDWEWSMRVKIACKSKKSEVGVASQEDQGKRCFRRLVMEYETRKLDNV